MLGEMYHHTLRGKHLFVMLPPLIGRGVKRCFCLTSVCLSVAYIGPKSRTERPRKTKIGTRDSDTTFKVKRSKVKVTIPLYSARRLRIRQLQRSPWERIHRGNLLLCCGQARSARRHEALRRPQRKERVRSIFWRLAHSLVVSFIIKIGDKRKNWGTFKAQISA